MTSNDLNNMRQDVITYERIYQNNDCIGCEHCQAGRWSGWSCRIDYPGSDDDYSCKTLDPDKEFWVQYIRAGQKKDKVAEML